MRRLFTCLAAAAAAVCVAAPAAASAEQQYFIGKGNASKTKVSFRLVNGTIKDGFVQSVVHTSGHHGPNSLGTFGAFHDTDLDSRSHFSCRISRKGTDELHPDYHFTFAGAVAGDEATGRTSASLQNGIVNFRTGQVGWEAEAVSKKAYDAVAEIGDALAQQHKRPACE